MKHKISLTQNARSAALLSLIFFVCSVIAQAQTTAFTYQGRFTDASAAQPTNGNYSMTFRLFDAPAGGSQVPNGSTEISSFVSVVNGVFTVPLDFGATAFSGGGARYLEIVVNGTILTPRQQLTSAPFAIQSLSATFADALSNKCLACVTNAQINSLDGSKITGTVLNAANAASTTNFSGNLSGDVTGTQSATVVARVGTQTASAVNTAVTAVNDATNLNNANAIVRRDNSGNFIAGTITATNFVGNVTGNVSGNAATVTGATNLNNANAIVKRDGSGNFIAGTITATNFVGNATTATTAGKFTSSLSGDVGGTQDATVIQPNAVTAAKIASNQVVKSLNGLKDSVTLAGGSGITVTPSGNTLTFSVTTPFKKFVVGGLIGGYQYDIDHNLNTTDVIVQVYNQNGFKITLGNGDQKYDGFVKVSDANHVRLGIFLSGTYRVTIIG